MARLSLDAGITNHQSLPVEARLLKTLQDLMELPALDLREALMAAAQKTVEALGCDKVDAFLLDEHNQTLYAVGTSDTPMGRRQRALGLDVLALANGGVVVDVFQTGISRLEGHSDLDPNELRGVVRELGARSTINVPLEVNGIRRGVLSAVSAQPEFFHAGDLQFLEAVGRWMGMLTHRAELAELGRKVESDQARRSAADEIITVLAHDLRNQLHPLLSRLHLMRLHVQAGRGAQLSEIEKAIRSVKRLSRLTDDLLDLKRLDEGLFSLNLVPVDLVVLASEAAASLATPAVSIRVKAPESLVVVADVDRIRQALENLVANAVRYSPFGKVVRLELGVEGSEPEECAVIEVIDEGPGIPPELLPTLFERFTSSPESKGLGLGLHLAHRIARVHRGKLSVESKLGAGTKFRLTIPIGTAGDGCES